jgi:hypothetical protein
MTVWIYNKIMDFKINRLVSEPLTQTQDKSASQAAQQTDQPGISGFADVRESSRPDFFSGEMLNAADLQQEQDYHIGHSANSFLEHASPETVKFLQDAGRSLQQELPPMIRKAGGDQEVLSGLVHDHLTTNFAILGNFAGVDIESLMMIVMMEAAKSAQEDLKAIMQSIQNQVLKRVGGGQFNAAALLQTPDAMHGEPKDYQQLQTVVQDLQTLLNSMPIPDPQKQQLQSELNQLDQLSHQIPIQPQDPDPNFAQALQLLNDLRSQLSAYTQ